MLTEKGAFVLECLNQGINLPLNHYDALWIEARSKNKTITRVCPTCGQDIEEV